MYFATSEEEPTFFLAQLTREALIAALPLALESTLRAIHHRDVTALPERTPARGNVTLRVVARDELAKLAREHCV